MKRYEDGYNAAQFHPDYAGWSIPQRTSSDMAANTSTKVTWSNLRIGDLMFFSSTGGTSASSVDHVGIYLGNNWMIHSSGSNDGVALEPVASGWYPDHFVYARRILTSGNSTLSRWYDPTGGDGPRQGGAPGL
jgi:peptidoglycan DL-endopeptidase LytE